MILKTKKLEIANICYANVSGIFADFIQMSSSGNLYNWNNFPNYCERSAYLWLMLNSSIERTDAVVALAKEYAKEIATTLITRAFPGEILNA